MDGKHINPNYHKEWWEKNKHKYNPRKNKTSEISKRDYENNKEQVLTRQRERRENNPEWRLWRSAKNSSKRKGLNFSIEISDIVISEYCPILKVPMIQYTPYCPSIDRIDNSKGYEKNNIQIISKKANIMKNNATKEELINFAKWIIKHV